MIRYISKIFNHISRLINTNAVHVELKLYKHIQNDYSIKLTFKANGHIDEYNFYMVDDEFHRSESIKKAEDAIDWINQCYPLSFSDETENLNFDLLIFLFDKMGFPAYHSAVIGLTNDELGDELLLCVDNSSIECNAPTYLTVNHTQDGISQACNFLLEKHFAYA
ncbi:hypothetical protein [Snodgrassella communis]|uniref:Uncharacterized protein n=1 Tax=Snodgrassella alvi TaxID=1196083 RepID=A0A2N9XPD0_9NEIS|nr:hypothetical protein [Snodgrassella communis]PIT50185.1 hypothetical protein BHC48_07205 [Snodgrassella communis]